MTDRFSSSMSDDELNEFLSELDYDDDEDIGSLKPEKEVVPKVLLLGIAKKEKAAQTYSPEQKASLMRASKANNIQAQRQRVKDVKREFVMSGNAIKLGEPISKDELRAIISYLTVELYEKANETQVLLTKGIHKELRKFIPPTIKTLFRTAPQAFVEYQGFEYETTPYYGSLKLHVKPDIPSVFSSPSEMQILRAKSKSRIFTFDKLVERYYRLTKKRIHMETLLAIKLSKVKVLVDLLDLGIRYYDAYTVIKTK